MENIYTISRIFFYFPYFFVGLHYNFYFLIGQTLFSTTKIHSIRLGANGIGDMFPKNRVCFFPACLLLSICCNISVNPFPKVLIKRLWIMHKKSWVIKESTHKTILTEVAGEGGPDLAPQKFLLSQKFRHYGMK